MESMFERVNLNGIYANISRAYEIAKVGGHTVTLCYYEDKDDKDRTVKKEDLGLINNFFGFRPVENGDLLIEVIRVQADEIFASMRRKYETLDDVDKRVEKLKNNPRPTEFYNEACYSLFKTSYERLSFGLDDAEKIFRVSQTIGQMDGKGQIRAEHIAEAIQYRALLDSDNVKRYFW